LVPLASLLRAVAPFCLATALLAQQGTPAGRQIHVPRTLGSQLLHVPGDHATVQGAVDAAAPGDRIVVHGGTHASITIDRPLTLVGDPAPLFVNGDVSLFGTALAPIRLAGPGAGRVVLCNVAVGGTVNGTWFSLTEAGIDGGGFDELHLYDCTVAGPSWVLLTGMAAGAPGLDVGVETLLVSDSSIVGSPSGSDDCYGSGPGGPAGIHAPGALTILMDSSVQGGGSETICAAEFCPLVGGAGGPGVVAATLLHADSTVSGGAGALYSYIDENWALVPCGRASDGPANVVTSEVELPAGLQASGTPRIGGTWTLAWDPDATAILLLACERSLAPYPLAFLGWYFIDADPGQAWFVALPTAGARTVYFPASEDLIGLTLSAQLYDLASGLTRPVVGCVRP
jgi:hypothetical protein